MLQTEQRKTCTEVSVEQVIYLSISVSLEGSWFELWLLQSACHSIVGHNTEPLVAPRCWNKST